MKRMLVSLGLAALVTLAGLPARAECYADYKAKRNDPLKLHYGVIALPDAACGSLKAAAVEIEPRIAVDGWTLLKVMEIFDETGLADEERAANAGEFYLRY